MCVHVCVHARRCTVSCTPSPIPSVRRVPKYEELSGGAAQAQLLHNPGGVTEQEVRELQSHLQYVQKKERRAQSLYITDQYREIIVINS